VVKVVKADQDKVVDNRMVVNRMVVNRMAVNRMATLPPPRQMSKYLQMMAQI